MLLSVQINNRDIGNEYPPYIVAEIGQNHNGSVSLALQMIDYAWQAGANAVKFQKRTVELCVPRYMWNEKRETPWGQMSYIDYRRKLEFGKEEYDIINSFCHQRGIPWFVSVWDEESVTFMERYNLMAYKIGSPSVTDISLIKAVEATERPFIISTGMSTLDEIEQVMLQLNDNTLERLILCHCTSIYPCPLDRLNLNVITTLKERWPVVLGYSGHERGTEFAGVAVALGARYLERHFTLDRYGWGSDQAASIEPWQMRNYVRSAVETWSALGDGHKVVYSEEQAKMSTLRRTLFTEVSNASSQ
tara:strand:- start:4066 stop:4977 length:912 start_codon:yes stop_codon:yes gene_type:complete